MGNVISLKEKLERWEFAYADPSQNFTVFASDHGRFKFKFKNHQEMYLEFVDSVNFLSSTSKAIEKAMNVLYEQT